MKLFNENICENLFSYTADCNIAIHYLHIICLHWHCEPALNVAIYPLHSNYELESKTAVQDASSFIVSAIRYVRKLSDYPTCVH